MIQDSIEYNEYKFNKRRESAVFSLRAFTAKVGSSLQQLVLYFALLAGSLHSRSNKISQVKMEAISIYGDNANQVGVYVSNIANSITGLENVDF